jgi:hypothetical protein
MGRTSNHSAAPGADRAVPSAKGPLALLALSFLLLSTLAGHGLTYAVAPAFGAHVHLHNGMHGYLSLATLGTPLLIALGFAMVLRALVHQVRLFGEAVDPRHTAVGLQRGVAAVVPAAVFVVMELSERASAGESLSSVIDVLLVGVPLQAMLGLLVRRFMAAGVVAAVAVARRIARPAPVVRRHAVLVQAPVVRAGWAVVASPLAAQLAGRAPPVALAS